MFWEKRQKTLEKKRQQKFRGKADHTVVLGKPVFREEEKATYSHLGNYSFFLHLANLII